MWRLSYGCTTRAQDRDFDNLRAAVEAGAEAYAAEEEERELLARAARMETEAAELRKAAAEKARARRSGEHAPAGLEAAAKRRKPSLQEGAAGHEVLEAAACLAGAAVGA